MPVYLVQATDSQGEDLSLFVTAPTPQEAVQEWRSFYNGDELEVLSAASDPDPDDETAACRIILVPEMAAATSAHDWEVVKQWKCLRDGGLVPFGDAHIPRLPSRPTRR